MTDTDDGYGYGGLRKVKTRGEEKENTPGGYLNTGEGYWNIPDRGGNGRKKGGAGEKTPRGYKIKKGAVIQKPPLLKIRLVENNCS